MYNVALSTMWGIKRFARFGDFFVAGRAAGFASFELNHGVNSAMLDSVSLNGYRITSVHEPCPADIPPAELKQRDWLISATDEENRRRGVEAVRRSIDLAQQLGAAVVIVHPGRVVMDESLEAELHRLYRAGERHAPAYERVLAQMIAERSARAPAHLAAVRRSLDELAAHAARRGVRLGLENRDHYYEIPLIDEMEALLDAGYGDTVGYWHDIGHAQKAEYKGYGPHVAWLTRLADRTIGVHLHDIRGLDDHLVAGTGHMPWEMVARLLPAGILHTCEFQNSSSPEQVAAGLRWLVENGLC
ncbi:MAG: TIM barrel protein [Anaerolineae bacterium]